MEYGIIHKKKIKKPGSVLLSRIRNPVPSAMECFTVVFGMGTCVATPPGPPGNPYRSTTCHATYESILMEENDNMVKPHGLLVPVG